MEYETRVDRFERFLLDNEVVTEDELALVTAVAGRSEEVCESILQSRCGFRCLEQAADEGFYMGAVLEDLDKSMLSEEALQELGLDNE